MRTLSAELRKLIREAKHAYDTGNFGRRDLVRPDMIRALTNVAFDIEKIELKESEEASWRKERAIALTKAPENPATLVEMFDTVTIEFSDSRDVMTIAIVPEDQLDVGRISQHSEIGKAILGSRLGDEVDVAVRGGIVARIKDIRKYNATEESE